VGHAWHILSILFRCFFVVRASAAPYKVFGFEAEEDLYSFVSNDLLRFGLDPEIELPIRVRLAAVRILTVVITGRHPNKLDRNPSVEFLESVDEDSESQLIARLSHWSRLPFLNAETETLRGDAIEAMSFLALHRIGETSRSRSSYLDRLSREVSFPSYVPVEYWKHVMEEFAHNVQDLLTPVGYFASFFTSARSEEEVESAELLGLRLEGVLISLLAGCLARQKALERKRTQRSRKRGAGMAAGCPSLWGSFQRPRGAKPEEIGASGSVDPFEGLISLDTTFLRCCSFLLSDVESLVSEKSLAEWRTCRALALMLLKYWVASPVSNMPTKIVLASFPLWDPRFKTIGNVQEGSQVASIIVRMLFSSLRTSSSVDGSLLDVLEAVIGQCADAPTVLTGIDWVRTWETLVRLLLRSSSTRNRHRTARKTAKYLRVIAQGLRNPADEDQTITLVYELVRSRGRLEERIQSGVVEWGPVVQVFEDIQLLKEDGNVTVTEGVLRALMKEKIGGSRKSWRIERVAHARSNLDSDGFSGNSGVCCVALRNAGRTSWRRLLEHLRRIKE